MKKNTTEAVFEFVRAFIQVHGYSPTAQEIGDGIGRAKSVVHYHVKQLAEAGRLTWVRGKPRTLRVLEKGGSDG